MIACYAWTNAQIINIVNAKANIYTDEQADFYIRMGDHISSGLVKGVKESKLFRNVFCIDSININYRKLKLGFIPNVRVLYLKEAYESAYNSLMEHMCPRQKYDRVLLTWFYTENLFLLNYWSKYSDDIKITFVEEGTGSYCYHKKEMLFPLTVYKSLKEKIKHYMTEYALVQKFAGNVDSICFYKPECCRPDIDFKRLTLPPIKIETNPIVHGILCKTVSNLDSTHFVWYEKRPALYFSSYNIAEGKAFENQSIAILNTVASVFKNRRVVAKVHTHSSSHADSFAEAIPEGIFIDKEKYIFEGFYAQLNDREKRALISCVSTAAIYPKFMFDEEPYVIFTYRLYDTYKMVGVERDDWMVQSVRNAYRDKSKVMVPNSMQEFREMLAKARAAVSPEYSIPTEI